MTPVDHRSQAGVTEEDKAAGAMYLHHICMQHEYMYAIVGNGLLIRIAWKIAKVQCMVN